MSVNADIVFIAPFAELYQKVNEVIASKKLKNVACILGDLEDGLQKGQQALDNGAILLISRGGTYQLLKAKLDAKVLELKPSAFDVASIVKSVLPYKEKIGIIGYSNMVADYHLLLADQNQEKLSIIEITSSAKLSQQLLACKKEGITLFIGDTVVKQTCDQLALPCILMESSRKSVELILDQAIEILALSKNDLEKTQQYVTLVDNIGEGCIALNAQQEIQSCNQMAAQLLNSRQGKMIGQPISDFLSAKQLKVTLDSLTYTHNCVVTINHQTHNLRISPVVIQGRKQGYVLIFQEAKQLQKIESNMRKAIMGKGFKAKYHFVDIIHESPVMAKCIEQACMYSKYDAAVMITGRTGVGKELFAQSIHNESNRKDEPFVAINCAALPGSIIESELFGYVGGAFTGSKKEGKAGVFELAHGGTLFLDEISELPLEIQGRLLRVIQEKEVVRVGGDTVIPLDVRIICATNKNLTALAAENKFRSDLLYRLNILPLKIPDLNQRGDDVLLLADYFLREFNQRYQKRVKLSMAAINFLQHYPFAGNVRELQNMIRRGVILSSEVILPESLSPEAEAEPPDVQQADFFQSQLTLEEFKYKYYEYLNQQYGGNQEKIAGIMGVSRSSLWRWASKYKELQTECLPED